MLNDKLQVYINVSIIRSIVSSQSHYTIFTLNLLNKIYSGLTGNPVCLYRRLSVKPPNVSLHSNNYLNTICFWLYRY